ncbi:hydroxyectoine utilization dehydratase EutB [Roseibium aggregatum]|uniref:Hydroxyectoine utilization dehydratase EutB n=1 Tax=Roseibium aggregatum TaxID=187304 RepID=A0A926S3S7_9HYPH|nr:hydroxyectoine utilization dehydratase EutB [Roseibium aggregatum]MBD1545633.1 hydroxyectoine utilization dehydratase EutB [Roseibium aggregatum]
MSLSLADVFAAQKTIAGEVVRTPLIPSPFLSERAGVPFLLKMETMQPTGAFKLRGATNAILSAPAGTKAVTCCSTGNHGRGVAYAARQQGIRATICMSSLVPKNKVDRIRALGAEVRIVGTSQDDAMAECLRLCETDGFVDISPFDDRHVISGQGTVGLEMLQDRPDLDMLLVPLSGGGLAGGVALAAKAINPDIRVIGISMDRGAAMDASIKAGRPVEVTEVASLADSLGGGIGLNNRLSFSLCRTLLDDIVLVSEEEIYRALQTLYFEDSHVAEGASVVGIAALLADKLPKPKGPTATIVTGRNVDMAQFTDAISGRPVKLGDTLVQGKAYDA